MIKTVILVIKDEFLNEVFDESKNQVYMDFLEELNFVSLQFKPISGMIIGSIDENLIPKLREKEWILFAELDSEMNVL